jgi:hypothetical protein
VLLAVKIAAVATPEAFVVAVFTPPAKVPLAPLAGAANVTVTPLTGLLEASFTVACKFVANAVLTAALCGVPAVAVMLAGGLATLVSEKLAGVATPVAVAVTLYGPPAVPLAVKTAEVATPLAFVTAVFTPPAKVPLAPLAGAVNVTVTPLIGLFEASFTVACSCVAKAVLTAALCGVPPVAVIVGPATPPPAALNAAKIPAAPGAPAFQLIEVVTPLCVADTISYCIPWRVLLPLGGRVYPLPAVQVVSLLCERAPYIKMSLAFVVVRLPLVSDVMLPLPLELTLPSAGELASAPLISYTSASMLLAEAVHVAVTLVTAAEFAL